MELFELLWFGRDGIGGKRVREEVERKKRLEKEKKRSSFDFPSCARDLI